MPSRRVIKSALTNFLGTYTSRNSDYQGYWLFGFVAADLSHCKIDLLAPVSENGTPLAFMTHLAVRRFAEQVAKAGLPQAVLHQAELEIVMKSDIVQAFIGSHAADGHIVQFIARATTSNRRTYENATQVFVAPHDPDKERRRAPEKWGPQELNIRPVNEREYTTNPEPRIRYLRKLVSVARSIVTYQVGLPQGCKRMDGAITRLKPYEKVDYPIFAEYLKGVRELPIGTSRLYWNRAALRELDRKLKPMNQKYRDGVFETCFEIIDRYAEESKNEE